MFNPGHTKGVNLTQLFFFEFSSKPPGIFRKKIRLSYLWSVDGRMNVEGRPYPKIFIDFAIKIYFKKFFEIISHNYFLFSHIIVWFYNIFMILNWNSEKQSSKFLKNFSFFYQNFQFSGSMTLYISCKLDKLGWTLTWNKFFSPEYPSRIPLKGSRRH